MGKLKLGILGNGYLADIIVEAGLTMLRRQLRSSRSRTAE